MTTAPEPGDAVDRHARRLHQAALAQMSPATLSQLRQARRADAPERRRPPLASWLAGGALGATLAVALVAGLRVPGPQAPDGPAIDGLRADADPASALENDPGFYLWLDSVDPTALAME